MTKIYAVAPNELSPEVRGLTAGKKYEARPSEYYDFDEAFEIVNDMSREIYCLWKGCVHLDDADWTRVEEENDDE